MNTALSNIASANPLTPVMLPELPLSRGAMDELYHFLQYLQFRYQTDLEAAIEVVEEAIDRIDAQAALAEDGRIPWQQVKQELGLD